MFINNKHRELVIVGAGGHGKVCLEVAKSMKVWERIYFLDKNSPNKVLGYDSYKVIEQIKTPYSKDYFIAIGDNQIRSKIFDEFKLKDFNLVNLIHNSAEVSDFSIIEGTANLFMKKIVINANSRIGNGNIFNTSSIIEHDCNIGDFNHFSPGSIVLGGVNIKDKNHFGSASVLKNNIIINENIIVGANSYCNKNIDKKGVYVGNPCRKIK